LSNLIVLDLPGIDIILGMDWLKKYDRVIHHTKHAEWNQSGICCSPINPNGSQSECNEGYSDGGNQGSS
jgi:hypothetical protein